MRKSQVLSFTFDNPNSATEFRESLKQILLDKLLADFDSPGGFLTEKNP